MPEIIKIDVTNISDAHISQLIIFFKETSLILFSQADVFHRQEIGYFSFTHSLIRWHDVPPSEHDASCQEMYFEVFSTADVLARGGQAVVHNSHGMLHIHNNRLSFSNSTPSVIKVGPESHFSLVEQELHQFSTSFNCKPISVVNGVAYLVMEKAPGTTLDRILKEKSLSIDQRFDLAMEIIDAALKIAHNGIHHRDIKPQNIIVDFQGTIPRVRIVDFGISKFAKRPCVKAQQEECFEGTVAFASPERYQGISSDNSDVFSIAMVLALIFGAVLKPTLPGWEVFFQGLEYAARMDYSNTLSVIGLSKRTLVSLEEMLTRMSFANSNLRMSTAMARDELTTIRVSYDALKNFAGNKEDHHFKQRNRLKSCWVHRNSYCDKKVLRQVSSLLSLESENEKPSPMKDKAKMSFSSLLFFSAFPAETTQALPKLPIESNSIFEL